MGKPCLKAAHPSPFSAYRGFLEQALSQINQYFRRNGGTNRLERMMNTIDRKQLSTDSDEIAQTTSKCKRASHCGRYSWYRPYEDEIYVRIKTGCGKSQGSKWNITFSGNKSLKFLNFYRSKGYNPEIDGILVQLPPAHLNVAGSWIKFKKGCRRIFMAQSGSCIN